MEQENNLLLREGAETFGVRLDERLMEAFDAFLKELIKWNRKINLTAIRTEKEIVTKHFLDSLSVCPHLPKFSTILDLGSGAGFPGIPIKMVDSSQEFTLMDSIRKKVDFQRHILRTLDLKGIKAIQARAEDRAVQQSHGDKYDRVLSRAFSDLQTFLQLSHPYLKHGGLAIAMKGAMAEVEIQSLTKKDLDRFRLQRVLALTLPFTKLQRTILLFEKQ